MKVRRGVEGQTGNAREAHLLNARAGAIAGAALPRSRPHGHALGDTASILSRRLEPGGTVGTDLLPAVLIQLALSAILNFALQTGPR